MAPKHWGTGGAIEFIHVAYNFFFFIVFLTHSNEPRQAVAVMQHIYKKK